jgi:beta-lactamase class A
MTSTGTLQDSLAPIVDAAPNGTRVSVYSEHLESGDTAAFDADVVFSAASTIKVAILAAVARAVDAGHLSFETKVPVRAVDVVPGSGVVGHMESDLALTIADHAYLMISISDNTTSNILIDQVGIEAVQGICREFATEGTMLGRKFFGRAAKGKEIENTVTSRGLATLLKNIVTGQVASEGMTGWMKDLLGKQQHRARLARSLGWDTEPWYGGKTGTITGVTNDCAIFCGPGGTVVTAIVSADVPDIYIMESWMGDIGEVLIDRIR